MEFAKSIKEISEKLKSGIQRIDHWLVKIPKRKISYAIDISAGDFRRLGIQREFQKGEINSLRVGVMFCRVMEIWIAPIPKMLGCGREGKGGTAQKEEKEKSETHRS